jgi:hypothetical protein
LNFSFSVALTCITSIQTANFSNSAVVTNGARTQMYDKEKGGKGAGTRLRVAANQVYYRSGLRRCSNAQIVYCAIISLAVCVYLATSPKAANLRAAAATRLFQFDVAHQFCSPRDITQHLELIGEAPAVGRACHALIRAKLDYYVTERRAKTQRTARPSSLGPGNRGGGFRLSTLDDAALLIGQSVLDAIAEGVCAASTAPRAGSDSVAGFAPYAAYSFW